jgi:hypothetical protein
VAFDDDKTPNWRPRARRNGKNTQHTREGTSAVPSTSQQVNGTPGSPSATTTINGKQLPPMPQSFHGKIDRNAAQSKPYWPTRVVPGGGFSGGGWIHGASFGKRIMFPGFPFWVRI